MSYLKTFLFAGKLAWKQITHEKQKLLAAVLGVMFATVLIFMQLGFRDSLFESAAKSPSHLNGDLFLVHKQTEAMWRTQQFHRSKLMRHLSSSNVSYVSPLYIAMVPFKNPETKEKKTIMMYGFDPYAEIFRPDIINDYKKDLVFADRVLFDEASRPDFGRIKKLLEQGAVFTEISDRNVEITATIILGTSFGADGNIATSDLNFWRLTGRKPDMVDIGVIRLRDQSKLRETKYELKQLTGNDTELFDYEELCKFEQDYWKHKAPIGFIFGFGMIMGMVVGMVIVYQILFTDITNHINEYATLKAIGYSNSYLVYLVFAQSILLALMGFFPGMIASKIFYNIAQTQTFIQMPMHLEKVMKVFFMILVMCFTSGLLAIRKLRSANPADMF